MGDTVTHLDRVRLAGVGIYQCHLDLAPITRIDQPWGVHDTDSVPCRKAAAGNHESGVARGQSDCGSCADSRALTRGKRDGLGRTQVRTGVARVGVARNRLAGEQNVHYFGHVSRLVQITGKNRVMTQFREKLWPAPGWFVATALVIPASLLVLAPISMLAGIITAVILYTGCVVVLILSSSEIMVADGRLRAGKAQVSLEHVGRVEAFTDQEAFRQRGSELDARAWLLIRGWVRDVVRVHIEDPADPVPYWLLSTRRPKELVAALEKARRPGPVSD